MQVKALACELPKTCGLPLSRFSQRDIARHVVDEGIVASISGVTVWRWLSADAIKPWSYRSWIWPRDPAFLLKGSRVLDLYQRVWEGVALGPDEYVICADEKTSIQARRRVAPEAPPAPGRKRRVEFEYERGGALAYLAAWDVAAAKVIGLCSDTTGIDPFRRLVDLVMEQEPYRSAKRVFWVVDNGSSHRGRTSIDHMSQWYPTCVLVHTPVHASWLNQVEIYFSVVQRKVLSPNEFTNLAKLEDSLMRFQEHYAQIAKPFRWRFTKHDLARILEKAELSRTSPRIARVV